MKYRTVVEVICDAYSKENAGDIAGEYLRGEADFGVQTHCKSMPLFAHKMRKYTASCLMALVAFSVLFLKVTPMGNEMGLKTVSSSGICETQAVTPTLKTKDKPDFKKAWEDKKQKAILDYLKF